MRNSRQTGALSNGIMVSNERSEPFQVAQQRVYHPQTQQRQRGIIGRIRVLRFFLTNEV